MAYDYSIEKGPSYSILKLNLNNEGVVTETGAMVYMEPSVEIKTQAKGGLFGVLKRAVVGESLFLNTFSGSGKLALAPSLSGDIQYHKLNGTLYVQHGAYLASSPNIDIDTKFGGSKSFFGGKGLFLMKLTGDGDLFLSSYGAIETVELNNESLVVDNGNLIGFTEGLDYQLTKVGGLKSTLLGGEGLVYRFSGTGTIYIQTRNVESFVDFILPYIPTQTK
ncbi:TIGR00266 family protein [Methanococcus voltae]|uniref:Uncharacterized protein (TIGR00266 family) n=2 Tax=Methanococcus voltae TaxID=2188 RepID=A0A8J7RGR0_METVO|nr:TIGR00266 family protein [Methanococcus voltae]MBP2173129.1 uncharacterized protein (TIGR00266 family) [Methanococcus voltae]MBP2202079.1 uncharacterized protein (TIGR00266 family) [Methanococcus voltae]MCS3922832.1 uncharacterized protein (TIGR00266 family) [Methanococcus voltae PS]